MKCVCVCVKEKESEGESVFVSFCGCVERQRLIGVNRRNLSLRGLWDQLLTKMVPRRPDQQQN